jgi:hypothetical protein
MTKLAENNPQGTANIADDRVLATGVFIIQGNKITFQRANYIEDGWYVEQIDEDIVLWEIPYGGGTPMKVCGYHDLISAIKAGTELS